MDGESKGTVALDAAAYIPSANGFMYNSVSTAEVCDATAV
jgi:hypothetical protein